MCIASQCQGWKIEQTSRAIGPEIVELAERKKGQGRKRKGDDKRKIQK